MKKGKNPGLATAFEPPSARIVISALEKAIPHPKVALHHTNPFELLIATILSAQCVDERVNDVTRQLFRKFPDPRKLGQAGAEQVEEIIRPTGFYKSKAKNLIGCSRELVMRFEGRVPETMGELVTLPGVGRKTANVLLGAYFGTPAVVVDTHVKRVAQRLGLTSSDSPDQIEQVLMKWMPKSSWTRGSLQLLLHGRYTCKARNPACRGCPILHSCRYARNQGQ
jgi:endonuclease III